VAAIATAVVLARTPSFAHTTCDMRFDLDGWSVFYKASNGEGFVDCDNGQRAHVELEGRGGGITIGRSHIVGTGRFSALADIDDIFGDYANAEAHAGIGASSKAQVVTKGSVSLTLSGTGTGVDLGFAFGRLTIRPIGHHERRRDERRVDEDYREHHERRPPREEDLDEREPPAPRDDDWRESPPPEEGY
jgi:hypothetical protein